MIRRQKHRISMILLMVLSVVAPLFSSLAREAIQFSQSKTVVPERMLSLIIGPEGYYPEHLRVFEGEKIKLFITSTIDQVSCFNIAEKEVFLSVAKGKITEGELYFERQGEYFFRCTLPSIEGKIIVVRKGAPTEQARSIASEKENLSYRVWRPKEK